jgi:hypothetical protein
MNVALILLSSLLFVAEAEGRKTAAEDRKFKDFI